MPVCHGVDNALDLGVHNMCRVSRMEVEGSQSVNRAAETDWPGATGWHQPAFPRRGVKDQYSVEGTFSEIITTLINGTITCHFES
jgi:hypothetical protein